MTTYKEIKGTNIEVLESDPSNPVEGQVWYNSTSNVLKGSVLTAAGAWATGGNLNTTRKGNSGGGTKDSAITMGGNTGSVTTATEVYNGTSWTSVSGMGTAKYGGGGGGASNTSAIAFGGDAAPLTVNTEIWSGSSWTEVANLNAAREGLGGTGIATSALAIGGQPSTAAVESWNGTSWTEVNDLNTARFPVGASGDTNTNALAFGGNVSPRGQTESWNGSSWTEVSDLSVGRTAPGGAGANNTSALAFGGNAPSVPGNTGSTELWASLLLKS